MCCATLTSGISQVNENCRSRSFSKDNAMANMMNESEAIPATNEEVSGTADGD